MHSSSTLSATVAPVRWEKMLPWALFVAFLVAATSGILSFGVQDNNEGLYATIAKEMLQSGEWIVPHLNGVPYLEKPPLLYWLVAGSMTVFGENEVAVRLVPVFFLGLTVLGLLRLLAQMGRPQTGYMAAAMLVSAGGFVVMSRSLLFDVPMTSFLIGSLVCFHNWRLRGARLWLYLFYACLALAVMAKGVTALVLGGGSVVVATAYLDRSFKAVLRIFDPLAILLFFVIAAPWHILAELRHPGFAHFYFINEHVLRFLNLREPFDYYRGPFYYYVVRLPMYLGLWTLFVPLLLLRRKKNATPAKGSVAASAVLPVAEGSANAAMTAAGGEDTIAKPALSADCDTAEREGRVLLWVVVLLPLLFFSISKAKANYYLLPSTPPLLALIALAWPLALNGFRGRRFLQAISAVLLPLALVALPVWLLLPRFVEIPAPWGGFVASWRVGLTLILLALCAVGNFRALRRNQTALAFAFICVGGLVPWIAAPAALSLAEPDISNREVAQFLNADPSHEVVFFRDYEYMSSLGFYLDKPVAIVDSHSNDLYYARHLQRYPEIFIDEGTLRQQARGERVFLVMRHSSCEQARSLFGADNFREVRRFRRLAVFTNEPSHEALPEAVQAAVR